MFILILIARDCYTRRDQDKIANNYGWKRFGSFDHLASLEIFIGCLLIIWLNVIYDYNCCNDIYRILGSLSLFFLFQCDWIHTSQATANFINPFEPNNIYGRIIYWIFGLISIPNIIIYILTAFSKWSYLEWNWKQYILCQICLYCLVSFLLSLQFFVICYRWCFVGQSGDSTMRGGIYGFLKHFSKLIWRAVFVFIKSLIVIIFIICEFWNYHKWFWQYIIPFCLQLWCLGMFLLRLSNRPRWRCCYPFYRKFVEYWYNYGAKKAKERNKIFPIQSVRWEIPKKHKNVVSKVRDGKSNKAKNKNSEIVKKKSLDIVAVPEQSEIEEDGKTKNIET